MAEYINRDELLAQYTGNILTAKIDYAEGLRDVIQDIKDAPVADVAPVVHGYWIKQEDPMLETFYTCSVCKDYFYIETVGDTAKDLFLYTYCPSCGCRMDGGSE